MASTIRKTMMYPWAVLSQLLYRTCSWRTWRSRPWTLLCWTQDPKSGEDIQMTVLTEHLNTMNKTGSIKFTDEPEKDGSIPFLVARISCKDDDGVKVQMYIKEAPHWPIPEFSLPPPAKPQAGSHPDPLWLVWQHRHGGGWYRSSDHPCGQGSR